MKKDKMVSRLMLLDIKKLTKKADREFQLLRRLEESDKQGVVRCISCGIFGSYKKFDGGHFIQRQHLGVRYEPNNVWPQCKKCNKWLSGNHAKYRDALIKKIGRDGVERLEEDKDRVSWGQGVTRREYLIESYLHHKELVKELKKSRGN